ncbi:hypothetical protein ACFYTS_19700 [Nocardia sp. NPDC004151]|uniref:hypothetical protein n=1 Tax=Nocardia sp. NPDC004151 TaxID=3364304 RepID=UPI0036CB249A
MRPACNGTSTAKPAASAAFSTPALPADAKALKAKILDSGLTVAQLVSTVCAAASSYRLH